MTDTRLNAAVSALALALAAAAVGWAGWALARLSFGQCLDGPCHSGTGDKTYGVLQAAFAAMSVAACVAAVITGCFFAIIGTYGSQFATTRKVAVGALVTWLVVVIVGRILGAR